MIGQLRLLCMLFVGVFWCSSLPSQTFKCDGRLILGTKTDDFTRLSVIDFAPFFIISYSPIVTYFGTGFEALGFNPKDNYIYAVRENTNTVVRLRSDGSFETLGSVPFVDQLAVFAGDCTPDGHYLCHDNNGNQILVFSVVDDFTLDDRIDLFWDPSSVNSGPVTTRLDDFAVDPNNPTIAYAFQATTAFDPEILPLATQGYLLSINLDFTSPDLGMVTPVAPITANLDLTRIGSLFFRGNGGLHAYGAESGALNDSENRLVGINTQTAAVGALGSGGPRAPATDGCSCPYILTINYWVEPLVATCTDDEVTYRLMVNNQSYEPLVDVTLTDTLPEGMLIEAIEGNFTGEIDPTTGVGTRFLTINNLQLPPRGRFEMTIRAQINDIPVGNAASQVYLRNLPSLFDGERKSDDPSTTSREDPAIFFADAQFLENVVLDITSPTDCLSDNDGQVLVSSPQFLPGVTYRLNLLNEDWEPLNREVVVDNNNSFFLDSIPSGSYRLDQMTPEGVRCSYEWKDTTIMIEAPNEQLQVSTLTNSPVCAGRNLRVSASLFPGGEVTWRGPVFNTAELSPEWEDVGPEFAGTYELTATYGACEKIRELEVVVEEAIEASISGEQTYCEREPLQLLAEGVGDSLAFEWLGPNNQVDTAQLLEITMMTPADVGTYQVVIDNGVCEDTARQEVNLLLSPTIELPQFVEADFCDPVFLQPKILGDNNVTYNWMPTDGLSCEDCPRPAIELPLQPSYQLQVINDIGCTDSARVWAYFRVEDLVYVPNAFSPNLDGVNDHFQLFPSCLVFTIKELAVYNRWGGQVFAVSSIPPDDPRGFWDGRVGGKPAAPGPYLWQAEIELIDGRSQTLTGEVNLLR